MSTQVTITKKMMKKLSELLAGGASNAEIANALSKEFDQEISGNQVKNIIRRQVIFKKQIIATDKEFKEIHKSMLLSLLDRAKKNMIELETMKDEIMTRFKKLKVDMPHSILVSFNRELSILVRTFNDTIRSINELLKRMETETSEVKLSQIQVVQETLKVLKDLEDSGYVKILPDYYKSDIYKETKKEVKK